MRYFTRQMYCILIGIFSITQRHLIYTHTCIQSAANQCMDFTVYCRLLLRRYGSNKPPPCSTHSVNRSYVDSIALLRKSGSAENVVYLFLSIYFDYLFFDLREKYTKLTCRILRRPTSLFTPLADSD
jgi:hypothetical protein